MPRVGSKSFDYGPAGVKAAAAEAKKTGKPMTVKPPTKGKK